MLSRSRLRMLADYFAATRNEVAVDEMFLVLSKMQASNVGYIPRVPHWIDLASRKPYLTRNLSRITGWLWLAGGAEVFFLREFFKFARLHRKVNSLEKVKSEGAILALSARVSDTVTPVNFPAFPETWLTVPWVPMHRLPKGAQELPMLSIINKRDLFNSLEDALIVTRRIKRYRHLSPWVLQTYTAFRWFIVRRAIDRLSGVIVTAEHYDRWAVLVDRAVRESRRHSNRRSSLVVVQHGAMGELNEGQNGCEPLLSLPTRLRQVDELHAYNSSEAKAFHTNVFPRVGISRALKIQFYKPLVELKGETASDRPRLLFVGHTVCESFHIEVFRKLKNLGNFEIFYKPHPKAPMSVNISGVGWKVISEANIFPRVDFLVSYPSTLVIEYENVGIPAFVHALDACNDDLLPIIEKINSFLSIENNQHK